MSREVENQPVIVIELGSSDDDSDGGRRRTRRSRNRNRNQQQQSLHSTVACEVSGHGEPSSFLKSSSNHQNQTCLSRRFWKAGEYEVPSTKSVPPQGQLEHARVHPKFLHSNATSHKWAFGAIAELLDNAVDEIRSGATFVRVDTIRNMKDNTPTLLFQDNGGGMDPDCMRQCMSLGYSSKKSSTTIGQYGNGFKTSTMRLGADVIVFSRAVRGSHVTESIGLLSYTFLRKTGQDDVIVPVVDFEMSENQAHPIIYSSEDDWSCNLKLILEWSPFASKKELMHQFDDIGVCGTKIIIYNLWLDDDGVMELDFNNDEEDICLRDEFPSEKASKGESNASKELKSHISYKIRVSLRAYVSILYLRKFTNFDIIIRGVPVQRYIIAENLNFTEVFKYRPQLGMAGKEVSVETTMGFVEESPFLGVTGFNVYHKNRLIRPFWRVTLDGHSRGRCAVGVLEANYIEPAHDKQDFERSALFIRLEIWLKQLINKYWDEKCHLAGFWSKNPEIRNAQKKLSDNQPVNRRSGLTKERSSYDVDSSNNSEEQINVDQPAVVGLAATSTTRQEFDDAPPIPEIRSMQKKLSDNLPINGRSSLLKERSSNQQDVDSSNYSDEALCFNQSAVVGLATSSTIRTTAGVGCTTNSHEESAAGLRPVFRLSATDNSHTNGKSSDGSSSRYLDQIREENLKFYIRCDELRRKEIELNSTIEGLEEKLMEARRRCAHLSSHLDLKRSRC
ncbi:hypothetical protein C5167_020892 [Papaver somniferum]|uniref:Morc S5 domain-containing protein n=1 Tax=Papaver somniferum TaxID=3469 RepID=A0A4Y7IWD3_PAPSO|nr:protein MICRORCHIDIA 2-like [Papaver somniferum]RZC52466.1 hypothetical protein C5167_020892 [Papaver somniferum]